MGDDILLDDVGMIREFLQKRNLTDGRRWDSFVFCLQVHLLHGHILLGCLIEGQIHFPCKSVNIVHPIISIR